ncbi:MAG: hypothetical protein JSU00_06555 [Acidobacteria bacterium]|nr:hypothetical protein [Acidobacteriota bacterium]
MLPNFLLPETVTSQNGAGPTFELGAAAASKLTLTLGITRIIEQESLDIEIFGSADGSTWSEKPILQFPQKFYCGAYSMQLDLSRHPDFRYLRVNYKVNRWGRGDAKPLFGFYVFGEETASVPQAAVA